MSCITILKSLPSDSIKKMKGSEVLVVEQGTNQSVCIRYIFNNTLSSSVTPNDKPVRKCESLN